MEGNQESAAVAYLILTILVATSMAGTMAPMAEEILRKLWTSVQKRV